MHKVEQAIIMAAGKGTRLRPLTFETPKPLIKVNGTPMIETVINGLIRNGISKIYVVVGYLKEKFTYLTTKYVEVSLIENPDFETANNISSMYVARKHLENAVVLDGDQIINDEGLLRADFEHSGYNVIWTQNADDEWILSLDEHSKIIDCKIKEIATGWRLYSLSHWSKSDGQRLAKLIEREYNQKDNRQIYWDNVPVFLFKNQFDLYALKMSATSIVEIDDIKQLVSIDSSYRKYLTEDENEN